MVEGEGCWILNTVWICAEDTAGTKRIQSPRPHRVNPKLRQIDARQAITKIDVLKTAGSFNPKKGTRSQIRTEGIGPSEGQIVLPYILFSL